MSLPRYAEYKDSGVTWVGYIPKHWEVSSLKRHARLLTEKAERKLRPIALENIEGWSGRFIETETDFEGDGVAFEANDILFGKLRPYLAKVLLAKQGGEAVGDFHVLRVKGRIFPRYAQYQMLQREFIHVIDGSTFGSKMPRANWESLGGMPFVVPEHHEQVAIAAFLDHEIAKIDALIAEQETLMSLLAEKRQAAISHAVTRGLDPDVPMKDSGIAWLGEVPAHWQESRVSNVCNFRQGKAHEPFVDEEGQFICVNSRFVSTGGVSRKHCNQNLTPVARNDILMVMSDLPNGRALAKAFFVQDDAPYAVNQRVCAVTVISAEARFMYYLLDRNPHFLSEDDGMNQTHLSNSAFTQMKIFLPSVAEQRSIAAYLDARTSQFDTLTLKVERGLELLKARRNALIAAAVTGKIDVRGQVEAQAA